MNTTMDTDTSQSQAEVDARRKLIGRGISDLSGREARQAKRAGMAGLLLLSVLVGLVGGYAAVAFYEAIDALSILFFASDEKSIAAGTQYLEWWQILLAPIIAGLIVGQLLRFIPGNKALGVPHVMEAAILRGGRLRLRRGLWSALITVISIGGGASTGREGPVVHLGATLASFAAKRLKLSRESAKTLLGCGAAAAVAASFNAPIAGVFFALEVILGHYSLTAFAPIVLASAVGTVVARFHIGDLPAFQVTGQDISSAFEFPAFFLLGVVAALLSALFMQTMALGDKHRNRILPGPYWIHPAIGGLIIGLMAQAIPEILGVGYEATTRAINGGYGLDVLVPLLVAKFIAVVVCLTCRFGGGVFGPSLVLGALLGGIFGLIAASIAPTLASSEGLYAIVGMGAVASAVLGAPISTVLIVFELTGDYSVAIAVMVASAAASLLVTYIKDGSLFHQQLRARGIHLIGGAGTHLLEGESIKPYATPITILLTAKSTVKDAYSVMAKSQDVLCLITNSSGQYAGALFHDRLPPLTDKTADQAITSLISDDLPVLAPSTPVGTALRLMEKLGLDILPVEDASMTEGIRVLRYKRILKAYNRALLFAQGHEEEDTGNRDQK